MFNCSSFDNLSNKFVEGIETTRTSKPLSSKIAATFNANETSLPVAINVRSTRSFSNLTIYAPFLKES